MGQLIGLLMIAAMFGLPIVGIIAFVQWRAKARREALAGPWSALAQRWQGTFAGDRVMCDRGDHQLTLQMVLVSVMEAAGGPYYPDGGTFTRARLAFAPTGPVRVATSEKAARVDARELAARIPAAAALPADARVILGPREAVVVLPGAVADAAKLDASFQLLDAIAQQARAGAPLDVAVAA